MMAFFKAFGYALDGIYTTLRYERNMRIHFACMAYMYYYLLRYDFFKLTKTQFSIILVVNAAILALELLNTAVERSCDALSESYNEKIKFAKDASAGAVLIAAIFAIIIGVILLYQPDAFIKLFNEYRIHIYKPIVFFISFVIAILFIAGKISPFNEKREIDE